MRGYSLSAAQEQLLRNQVVDAERPGPVLHDFRTVMDAVGTEGVKAGGKYNLLPLDLIGPLDERLTRPLRLRLQRPQLCSHPYLQGLHLLLRASGLGRVVGKGDKARLAVDPELLERWQGLNPTEQYFNLLEAWLLVGCSDMIGERGRDRGDFLMDCLQAWQWLPAKGQKARAGNPQGVYLLGIGHRLYLMALMDLFGLLEVEQPKRVGQRWAPAAVRHSPFGDAACTLLARWFDEDEEGTGGPVRFGRWQPLFQPYSPEWQNNLVLPGEEIRKGILVFRVSLGDAWRRIAMPADATVDDLVAWILKSVRFDNDHLYALTYRDRFGAKVDVMHPACDEGPWGDQVLLGELPLEPGGSVPLLYDFGDNWKFNVKLERIEPPGARIKAPQSSGEAR